MNFITAYELTNTSNLSMDLQEHNYAMSLYCTNLKTLLTTTEWLNALAFSISGMLVSTFVFG